MKITFDTANAEEVTEVRSYLESMMAIGVTQKPVKKKTTPKVTPTIKEDVKEVVEAPTKVEEVKETTISLADLKDSAKNAVGRTDRDKVKTVINEFAEKLAEVAEKDFGKLYKKLQELS